MNQFDAVLADIDGSIARAVFLDDPGDEVYQILTGECVWTTGQNQSGTITVVVPRDADFYAKKFELFLGARIIDETDLQGSGSDQAFRPAGWCSVNNNEDLDDEFSVQAANATFAISDTFNGPYQAGSQSVALNIAAAYSGRYGQSSVANEVILSAWPGGRKFFIPMHLKRGSALTCGVKPTFGRASNAETKTQFRATLVLSGYRVIRRAL